MISRRLGSTHSLVLSYSVANSQMHKHIFCRESWQQMIFSLLLLLMFVQRGISQLPDWNAELEVSGKNSSLYDNLVLSLWTLLDQTSFSRKRFFSVGFFSRSGCQVEGVHNLHLLLQVRQNGLPSRRSQATRTGRGQRLFVLEVVRRVTGK